MSWMLFLSNWQPDLFKTYYAVHRDLWCIHMIMTCDLSVWLKVIPGHYKITRVFKKTSKSYHTMCNYLWVFISHCDAHVSNVFSPIRITRMLSVDNSLTMIYKKKQWKFIFFFLICNVLNMFINFETHFHKYLHYKWMDFHHNFTLSIFSLRQTK